MTINSSSGHNVLFMTLREMKQTEAVHVDTSTLLSLRGVNRFFRDYVDSMFDPEHKLDAARIEWKQSIDEFHEEKTGCEQKIKENVTEAERDVERWTDENPMILPFLNSIWTDVSMGEWPDLRKAAEIHEDFFAEVTRNLAFAKNELSAVQTRAVILTHNLAQVEPGKPGSNDFPELNKKAEAISAKEKAYQLEYVRLFSKNRIFDFFGGRLAFEKLPVYDWQGKREIDRHRLTAPIMRGQKNNFFIVRSVSEWKNSTMVDYQLFIDYGTPTAPDWFSNGSLLKLRGDYFIQNGKAQTKPQKVSAFWYNEFVKDKDEPAAIGEVEIPGSITRIANFIQSGGNGWYKIS